MTGLNFLAVDDEMLALEDLVQVLKKAEPQCNVFPYSSPETALDDVRAGKVVPNVAFLDIEMPVMTGLELARRINSIKE